MAKADKAIIAPREVLGHFIQCSVFHGVGQLGHAGHAPLAHNADGQPLVGDSHTLVFFIPVDSLAARQNQAKHHNRLFGDDADDGLLVVA